MKTTKTTPDILKNITKLFFFIFLGVLVAGCFVMLILPVLFPSGHLGKGLFIGDSTSFHEGAVTLLAEWEKKNSIQELFIKHPKLHDWFIAAVYAFTAEHPLFFLPVQAFNMACAGVLFFLIMLRCNLSSTASTVGAIWLSLNPQTFEWSTQLSKDGFFLTAILLFIYVLFLRRFSEVIFFSFLGCVIILALRSHWLRVLIPIFLVFVFFKALTSALRGIPLRFPFQWKSILLPMVSLILCYLAIKNLPQPYYRIFVSYEEINREIREEKQNSIVFDSSTLWKQGQPKWLNNICFEIYQLRFTGLTIGGRSILDEDKKLNSFPQQIAYLPRALQVGIFAPFPEEIWLGPLDGRRDSELGKNRTWPQEGLGRKTTQLAREFMPWLTLLCTLALLGIALAIAGSQTRTGVVWLVLFCLPQLALLAMVCPNLGTFVRLRYPFYAPLVCVGLAAWVDWWRSRKRRPEPHS